MVADVAHELRTPLSMLQGHLYALLEGVYPLTPAQIALLYDQTRLLNRLVNDLHELSQAEARQLPLYPQAIDLSQLLHEILEAFRLISESQAIQLDAHLQSDLPPLWADPQRVQQIIHNLLSNALRHSRSGGRVVVEVRREDGGVSLSIRDDGDGMSAEQLERVFDRFYRADASRDRAEGGAGLGLTISRMIAELHGGRLSAHSDGLGHGSAFTLWLPLNPPTRAV
jgi:two-component system, OmpR family, sensor histidine kinase BaeS